MFHKHPYLWEPEEWEQAREFVALALLEQEEDQERHDRAKGEG